MKKEDKLENKGQEKGEKSTQTELASKLRVSKNKPQKLRPGLHVLLCCFVVTGTPRVGEHRDYLGRKQNRSRGSSGSSSSFTRECLDGFWGRVFGQVVRVV